jgi:hypothetical protein
MKASNARGQRISGTKLEQQLDSRLVSHASAIRYGQMERAELVWAEIESLRAEIAKRREAAQARSAKRSAEAKDIWFREQMAKATLNK